MKRILFIISASFLFVALFTTKGFTQLPPTFWANSFYMETYQNGIGFGTGKVLSVLNDVITFDGNRLDDRNKDIFYQEDFEGASVSFTCGTDLTAADETAAPIKGTSKSFTQGATPPAVGIKCESAAITLSPKEQDKNIVEVCFNSEWNGNNNEMALNVYGNTSAANLVQVPITASSTPKKHCGYFTTSGEASIDYHIEVLTQNANKILLVDSIQLKVDPLAPTDIYASSEWENLTFTSANLGTVSNFVVKGRQVGDTLHIKGFLTSGTPAAGSVYIDMPSGYEIDTTKLDGTAQRSMLGWWSRVNGTSNFTDATYSGILTTDNTDLSAIYFSFRATNDTTLELATGTNIVAAGDSLVFEAHIPIAGWSDTAQGVVVKNRTDSASVENVFSAKISSTGVVSDENIEWIAAANVRNTTGLYDIDVTALGLSNPLNCVANMNTTNFGEPFQCNVDKTLATATNISVRCNEGGGTGAAKDEDFSIVCQRQGTDYIKETDKVYTVPVDTLTGNYVRAEGNGGTAITSLTTDIPFTEVTDTASAWDGDSYTVQKNNSTVNMTASVYFTAGTAASIILYKNASIYKVVASQNVSNTVHVGSFTSSRGEFNAGDVLTIRFSDSRTLQNDSTYHYLNITEEYGDRGVFLGNFSMPTCYLKDIKADATDGGTFTSGSFQTRTLNTTEGSCSFLSLASNQFTLEAGSYNVDCSAPAFGVASHQSLIRNTTDSTNDILGSREYGTTAHGQTTSKAIGVLTLNSSKTYELQHRAETTRSTDGFGRSNGASFGVQLVYAQCAITKVR